MPVYEYQCGACSHAFEEWQKITDAAIKTCPKCGEDKVERLISQTAFMLKGGGWYKDLYSSSKSKDASPSSADSSNGKKSEGKSDSGGSAASTPAASSAPASTSSTPSSTSSGSSSGSTGGSSGSSK